MDDTAANGPLPPLLTELAADSSISAYVQGLLFQKPLLIQFRPDMEHCFHTKRCYEFSQIFRIAGFLWLTLYLAILGGAIAHFDYIFRHDDYLIWQSAFLMSGLLVLGLNICAWLPSTHYLVHHYVLAPAATLLLYQLLVGSVAYADSSGNIYASYNIIITMIVIAHSLRFLWPKSLLILLCSGGMAAATIFINNWHVPALQALHAFGLIGAVLVSIAFFVERRERLGFLHEVLVAVKSRELERINNHLATLAREDALSGLANRRAFDACLDMEWDRAKREQQSLSLLFIDIDHFKLYNDSYGHAAGDDCLRQVAQAMKKALLRPADTIARYGGEEFVILLPCTDALGAEEVADRVLRTIDTTAIPHKRSLVSFHVTISIGICTMLPHENNKLSTLLENADAALYKAKTAGRHCFRHYIEPAAHSGFNFHQR